MAACMYAIIKHCFPTEEAKVIKTEDDAVPVPLLDSYPLPKTIHSICKKVLNKVRTVPKTQELFITEVANSMLCYKRYPSKLG